MTKELELPIRAAREIALAHGVTPDRCEVLQNGHTLVLRLTDDLVARVVNDQEGPRQGLDWFRREISVAGYLAGRGAPVIPVHPDIPPGPHEHSGYPVNFWRFVTVTGDEPEAGEIGRTLRECHVLLDGYPGKLPELAILAETLSMLETLDPRGFFPRETLGLLRERLVGPMEALRGFPFQALHGDAHPGNLMKTTRGVLLTDWEDTFSGPVEWDLASMIWNARLLEEDHAMADGILNAYRDAGGTIDGDALQHSLVARAAVMSAWYPVLYPDASPERMEKLRFRLEWLEGNG